MWEQFEQPAVNLHITEFRENIHLDNTLMIKGRFDGVATVTQNK